VTTATSIFEAASLKCPHHIRHSAQKVADEPIIRGFGMDSLTYHLKMKFETWMQNKSATHRETVFFTVPHGSINYSVFGCDVHDRLH